MKKRLGIGLQSMALPFLCLALLVLLHPALALAQAGNTIHVPKDFPDIQSAINAAGPGDTILVAEGRWCGANVTQKVNLVGLDDDTVITACPSNPGPTGVKRGFIVANGGAGSTIRNFSFDGNGYSDANTDPIAIGIGSGALAQNVTIQHNHFVGGIFGVIVNSTGWNVSENVFENYTLLNPPSCLGGAAISSANTQTTRVTNSFTHNKISTSVPAGSSPACSWIIDVDVPSAGIVVAGQDGTVIAQNKISITGNANHDEGAGVIASDHLNPGIETSNLNLMIKDNDARNSAFSIIVTTGNSSGAVIRDNKGNSLVVP